MNREYFSKAGIQAAMSKAKAQERVVETDELRRIKKQLDRIEKKIDTLKAQEREGK